jgi:hypothetical protein
MNAKMGDYCPIYLKNLPKIQTQGPDMLCFRETPRFVKP